MRIFNIGPAILQPFEIGALLMAILAFPSVNEGEPMEKAIYALCADAIRAGSDATPTAPASEGEEYSEYASIDALETRRRLRTLRRRLSDRMIAARMSLGFFKHGVTGEPSDLPESMARLSLNELSKLVLDQSRESVAENVVRRAWRQSLPVIHLAAAYHLAMSYSELADTPFEQDLQHLESHRRVVRGSQILEPLVLADRRFGISPEKLVRLRWVE